MTYVIRIGFAATLAISGISHAYLYVHGYQYIPTIGAAFAAQAGKLVNIIGNGIFFFSPLKGLFKVQTGNVNAGRGAANTEGFAVRKCCYACCFT